VLGPLLFVIFINDLDQIFNTGVTSKFFADDAKVYTVIKSDQDIVTLQENIDKLVVWANDWQLKIAFDKCSVIDFSTSAIGDSRTNSIEGAPILMVDNVKDLGVTFDCRLKFSIHIAQIKAKVKQRLFLLFRAFRLRDKIPLVRAFKSYILPLLSYCSSVWSPVQIGEINDIESVQRLFTRRVAGMENKRYKERLKLLNLPSLELRRLWADLLLCFKIIHGHVAGGPEAFGLRLKAGSTRGHSKKLFAEHTRIEARRNFFSARIVRPWNSLTDKLVNSESIASFKRGVKKCNLKRFLVLDLDEFCSPT
jgi:hypothetical protein